MSRRLGLFALRKGADRHSDLIALMRAAIEALAGVPSEEPEPPTGTMPTGHVETRLTDDGLIWTPEGTPSREVSDAIVTWFPHDIWTDAARVSYYESHWSNVAELNTLDRGDGRCGVRYWYSDEVGWATTEQSVGLFQINVCAHGHDREYWRDPLHNVAKASGLYHDEGWRPWRVTATRLRLI